MAEQVPIRAFLSYARADDEEFGFVDPLVGKLKALVKAKTGRTLEVFVDRDSIGWGENWRERLAESVQNATIFLPMLTATYLEREACREEFLAFHAKAVAIGVTELLLPILVFRSPLFNAGSTDDVVAIAEGLQYICIEDALLSGYDSATWLRCMSEMADALIAALAGAEASLANGGYGYSTPLSKSSITSVSDDELGVAELMTNFQSEIEELAEIAPELEQAIARFGEVPNAVGNPPEGASPSQMLAYSIRVAAAFDGPSHDIENLGRSMFSKVRQLDSTVLGLRTIADQLGEEGPAGGLHEGLDSIVEQLGDLAAVEKSMEGLLESMRPAESFSVPLRKSLAPARRGLTAISDSVRLLQSWRKPEA